MKILQLSRDYYPHRGGVETHVQALSQELTHRGHQVQVLTLRHSDKLSLKEKINGVPVTRLDIKHHFSLPLFDKLETWQQLARHSKLLYQADIIQVHDVMWWLLPLIPLFISKIYLTFHGWEGEYPIPRRTKLARWLWSKLALRTIHVGDYIQQFYWDQPSAVVYGGVDLKNLPAKKTKKSKNLRLVFIGRLEQANDIELYLELVHLLQPDHRLKVIWVGDGAWREECEQIGTVTGMVAKPAEYLAQADLVLAASYLSILQAQALGKIVVSAYSQPLKESYLKTYPGSKWLLLGDSAAILHQQINQLFTDQSLQLRFSRSAQNWARQQTWSQVAAQYLQLWGMK